MAGFFIFQTARLSLKAWPNHHPSFGVHFKIAVDLRLRKSEQAWMTNNSLTATLFRALKERVSCFLDVHNGYQ
jgi:hypothetical protein